MVADAAHAAVSQADKDAAMDQVETGKRSSARSSSFSGLEQCKVRPLPC